MSLTADAVKEATRQKEERNASGKDVSKKPAFSSWAAPAIFTLMALSLAALYFYENAQIAQIQNELGQARLFIDQQKSEIDSLLRDKEELQKQVSQKSRENQQRIDELLGKVKVLGYEKETLESDNAQKEKKLAELVAQIQQQDQKEAGLMALIEEAQKRLAATPVSPPAPVPTSFPAPAAASDKA